MAILAADRHRAIPVCGNGIGVCLGTPIMDIVILARPGSAAKFVGMSAVPDLCR